MSKNGYSKYKLIIQGPILSKGISGKTFTAFFYNTSNNYTVEYNCINNINRIINNFEHLFDEIAISTWENETICREDIQSLNANLKLIKSKDDTKKYINKKHPNGQIGLLKQFLSIQKGIENFDSINDDAYVIKIRTDQYVNLELLIQEHKLKTEAERNSKIFVSHLMDNSLGDFYLVSTIKVMTTFCESIMNIVKYPQINVAKTSVHLAIPYAYYVYKEHKNVINERGIFLKSLMPVFSRLGFEIHNCNLANDLMEFIDANFDSLSLNLLYQADWRGDTIEFSPHFSDKLSLFDGKTAVKINCFNFFIFLSPETYFEQKGKKDLTAILGLINFMLITKFNFYKNLSFKKYTLRKNL